MVAITAELYGDATPPAVLVTITGLEAVERLNVWREAPATPRAYVRGGVDVDPVSDAVVLVDVMPDLGRPLIYVAETFTAADATPTETSAAPVTVPDPGRHVLSDATTGEAVLVDLVAGPDERSTAARASVLRPAGRRRPVVLHDVRADDEGALEIYTRDRAETADLVALLATGRPIVSRHPFDGCDVAGVEILAVAEATRARRTRAGDRLWSLPFVVVDMPDPRLAAVLVDLGDLAAYYPAPATLGDLAAAYPTLLDLARDDLGAA